MGGRTRAASARSLTTMRGTSLIVALPLLAVSGPATTAPDIELGRYLATECLTCHRTATATSTIPNIFGMAEPTFAEVVRAYRDKRLPNPVMQTIAGRLKDDE